MVGNVGWSAEIERQHVADFHPVSLLSIVVSGMAINVTEALSARIPFSDLRPIVEGIVAQVRRGAVECLDEDGTPPGFETWAHHPWFTRPPLTEEEWRELEEEHAAGLVA